MSIIGQFHSMSLSIFLSRPLFFIDISFVFLKYLQYFRKLFSSFLHYVLSIYVYNNNVRVLTQYHQTFDRLEHFHFTFTFIIIIIAPSFIIHVIDWLNLLFVLCCYYYYYYCWLLCIRIRKSNINYNDDLT